MRLVFRQAVRGLTRDWKFSLAVTSSLAIACGSLCAVSTIAFQVLLRPLDFPRPEALALLYEGRRDSAAPGNDLSPGSCRAVTELRIWESAGCWMRAELRLGSANGVELIHAMRVTPGVLPALGAMPERGRWLSAEDGEDAAVISHPLWQTLFGGASDVVGRRIQLEGRSVAVVGVMPRGFQIHREPVAVYQILQLRPEVWNDHRRAYLGGVGRLRAGVDWQAGQAEARALALRLEAEFPSDNPALRLDVVGMQEDLTKSIRQPIQLLWVTAFLLIVLAVFNVANLLFSRGKEQAGQFALQLSLGATRWQMLRQALGEAMLLAVLGGVCGIGVAAMALPGLRALIPVGMLASRDVRVDPQLALLVMGTGMLAALLSAAVPSWRAIQPDLLRVGIQRGMSKRGSWAQDCLLGGQVALAALLLVSAAFLIRSWEKAQAQHLGFQSERVSLGQLHPGTRGRAFLREVLEKLEAAPGVESAALSSAPPLTWRGGNLSYEAIGVACEESQCRTLYREISPRYFETLQIPIEAGRGFDGKEAPAGEKVVVVNAAFARATFGGSSGSGNAVGKAIRFRENGRENVEEWRRIVGVAGDTRDMGVEAAVRPMVYVPWQQSTQSFAPPVFAVVKGNAGVEAIRRASREVDDRQPVAKLDSLAAIVAKETELRRLQSGLAGFFAFAAVALATTGLHAILAFRLARRRRELGLRVALGASSWRAGSAIAGRSYQAATLGLLAGIGLAVGLARWAEPLLFNVSPADVASYAIPGLLLLGTLSLVAWRPVREAARANPAEALRDGGGC